MLDTLDHVVKYIFTIFATAGADSVIRKMRQDWISGLRLSTVTHGHNLRLRDFGFYEGTVA